MRTNTCIMYMHMHWHVQHHAHQYHPLQRRETAYNSERFCVRALTVPLAEKLGKSTRTPETPIENTRKSWNSP